MAVLPNGTTKQKPAGTSGGMDAVHAERRVVVAVETVLMYSTPIVLEMPCTR